MKIYLITAGFFLLASTCLGQQNITLLEQLRERKDTGGDAIFSDSLRGHMKFAEGLLTDFVARRGEVWEEERKNIPGQSYVIKLHRDQLAPLEVLVRTAFARAAYVATQESVLQAPER